MTGTLRVVLALFLFLTPTGLTGVPYPYEESAYYPPAEPYYQEPLYDAPSYSPESYPGPYPAPYPEPYYVPAYNAEGYYEPPAEPGYLPPDGAGFYYTPPYDPYAAPYYGAMRCCPRCNYDPCRCVAGCFSRGRRCLSPYPGCASAAVCGTRCGLSVCSFAAAIAAVVGVAAIIVASPGASTVHAHNP